ncbi:MAG: GGDEF domain-containing protein [Desulfobacterales bacterium]|nr:GGDEF domain-containing protein [Desulfobacterales bacterium]
MQKHESDAKTVLNRLGHLSVFLKDLDADAGKDACFNTPLEIVQQTLNFDISVLYKVSNVIEDKLILEVVKVLDPQKSRMDLREGRKLRLYLDARDKRYVNEVNAFLNKSISCINVPGMGCDIMGYVYVPRSFGGAYLFGGDFFGNEAAVQDHEKSTVEIMCNFLSTILLKTRFQHRSEVDELTGLFNSAKIKERVQRATQRFKRKVDRVASVAMGDIDFFKKINDRYGHLQGDVILKEVGIILEQSMREYFDIAGRYGGEEFLLIFDETDGDMAVKIVERIRHRIQNYAFSKTDASGMVIPGAHLNITMSFGVAELSGAAEVCTHQDWVSRADRALYASKQNGRNQTTLAPLNCPGDYPSIPE